MRLKLSIVVCSCGKSINIYTYLLTILHNLCKCPAQCLVYRDHSNVLRFFPVLILNSFMSTAVCVIVLPTSASVLTICFPYNKLKKVSKHKPDYVTSALKIFQYYPSVTMKKKKEIIQEPTRPSMGWSSLYLQFHIFNIHQTLC